MNYKQRYYYLFEKYNRTSQNESLGWWSLFLTFLLFGLGLPWWAVILFVIIFATIYYKHDPDDE